MTISPRLRSALRLALRLALTGASLIAVIALGIASRFFCQGPFASWVSEDTGGVLGCVACCLVLALARPRAAPGKLAVAALGVTGAMELLQLWHPHFLEVMRATPLRLLLGSVFAWSDFLCYGLGALLGWAWLRVLPAACRYEIDPATGRSSKGSWPSFPRPYGVTG
jgi:hypothetical protein